MSEDFEYKAFLSYSHKDKKWGARLHKALEKYRIPKNIKLPGGLISGEGRTIGRIFRDRDELPAADDLTEAVQKALRASEYLIVLCSPAAAASRWVNKEVLEFKRLRGDRYVLPIIIDGEPFASDSDQPELECFPPGVRYKIGNNGSLSTIAAEPSAADARKEADGEKNAVLKLVAGVLGVGLDQLIDREMRRRHKRVMSITAGAVLGMIVMGALTINAMQAREAADIARVAADRHRAEAEDLVEFMLTDLREKLEPVGRLDVLDAVGDKVVEYYDKQEAITETSDDAVGRKARSMHLLGDVERKRGDMAAAQAMFEQSMAATEELLRRDPNNPKRIFEHAQSVFWVGNQDFVRGNFKAAEGPFREYLRLAERLVEIEPDNVDYQVELAYGNSNMGDLYLRELNQPRRSLEYFQEALRRFKAASDARPDSWRLKERVVIAYSWLARAYRRFGHVTDLLKVTEQEKETLDSFLEGAEDNLRLQKRISAWYGIDALIQRNLGKNKLSIASYSRALAVGNELLGVDVGNSFWISARISNGLNKALLLIEERDFAEAESHVQQAREDLAPYIADGLEGSRRWRRLGFLLKEVEITLLKAQNLNPQAWNVIETSFVQLAKFKGTLKNTQAGRRILLIFYLHRYFLQFEQGLVAEARNRLEEVWDLADAGNLDQNAEVLALMLDVAEVLGKKQASESIRQTLMDRGYGNLIRQENMLTDIIGGK